MNPDLNELDQASWFIIICKSILLVILCYFSFQLIFDQNHWTPLDWTNLMIHEAGHGLLIFANETFYILGGTILQLFVPFLIILYFLYRKSCFSSLFGLFWMGNSLIYTGIYMKDARAQQLPLLIPGGINDWTRLFGRWGLLQQDQIIGGTFFLLGCLLILCSTVLMGIVIYLDIYKRLR